MAGSYSLRNSSSLPSNNLQITQTKGPAAGKTQAVSLAGQTAPSTINGDHAFARRPRVGAQIPEKIQKPFDDIAKYFSKKEWEKMKYSEKIICVYMKRKYEAMTKLGFKVTLPPFMRNKWATDFQGNDSDNDCNRGNQVECPQMTFGRLQGIFLKIMPKMPAEEGNNSKGMSEASGSQNNGKQLCPLGKPSTSEKINVTSGNREAQEEEERPGTAHWWSSQNTHNIGPKRGKHAWTHRLRERKQLVIYEEISDAEEDEE
nr:protein SSX3-like [Macaca fascicularis]